MSTAALAVAFKLQVIRPAITRLGLWSEAAETLLLMTAAHESAGWKHVRQHPSGPGVSFYQIEPGTLEDFHKNWLSYRPQWRDKLIAMGAHRPQPDRLVFDAAYATTMARLLYYRDDKPLPAAGDLDGLAAYAKRVWNTSRGKATAEKYRADYERYCL